MIETTIPEIDVNELMHRVRLEAAKLERGGSNGAKPRAQQPILPAMEALAPPPPLILPNPLDSGKERLEAVIEEARRKTEVERWIPKIFRGLFRKQGNYNRLVLQTIGRLNKTNAALAARLQQLSACVGVQHNWLQTMSSKRDKDVRWMHSASQVLERVSGLEEKTSTVESDAALLQDRMNVLETELREARHEFDGLKRDMAEMTEGNREAKTKALELGKSIGTLAHEGQAFKVAVDKITTHLEAGDTRFDALGRRIEEAEAEFAGNITRLQAGIAAAVNEIEAAKTELLGLRSGMDGTAASLEQLANEQGRLSAESSEVQATLSSINGQIGGIDHAQHHLSEEVAKVRHESQATTSQLSEDVAGLRSFSEAHATESTAALEEVRATWQAAMAQLAALQKQLEWIEKVDAQLERFDVHVNNVHTEHNLTAENTRILRGQFDHAGEHLRNLQAQTDGLAHLVETLQKEIELRTEHINRLEHQLQGESGQRSAVEQNMALLEQRQTSDGVFIKSQLTQQASLLRQALEGSVQNTPNRLRRSAGTSPAETKRNTHQFDSFYFGFENRFRGPRDEIKKRVRFYLPYLRKARIGTKTRPVVDVGCGRGEWLELLRENKLSASGIDLNTTMVEQCRERKLDVRQGDAIDFLHGLKAKSLGAVTGFHIIEHLPFETLMELFVQVRRVLKPGGLAIFESPNCKNLVVGACNFNIDPTHRNPVFPETAQFMLETFGFERVTIDYLSPVDLTPYPEAEQQPPHLRNLLYGPQDFGVIGYAPHA